MPAGCPANRTPEADRRSEAPDRTVWGFLSITVWGSLSIVFAPRLPAGAHTHLSSSGHGHRPSDGRNGCCGLGVMRQRQNHSARGSRGTGVNFGPSSNDPAILPRHYRTKSRRLILVWPNKVSKILTRRQFILARQWNTLPTRNKFYLLFTFRAREDYDEIIFKQGRFDRIPELIPRNPLNLRIKVRHNQGMPSHGFSDPRKIPPLNQIPLISVRPLGPALQNDRNGDCTSREFSDFSPEPIVCRSRD